MYDGSYNGIGGGEGSSSLVVYLKSLHPTAKEMWVRMRGRKYSVDEYE